MNTDIDDAVCRRVVVSVTNDLVTDQRVHRTCSALVEQGYRVTLVGRMLPGSAPLQREYRTVRMRLVFRKKALFYAEYNVRLFLRLLFSRAEAFYANDTDSLPANYYAAVLRRKPLFFDAHEMFPEVPELVGRPAVKRFWERIEKSIFPKIARSYAARRRFPALKKAAAVTVCQSIADEYRQRYGLEMGVVRNVPMTYPAANDDAGNILAALPRDKKIILYQGAVNIGRGIEWAMDAMPYLPDCHLVVAGTGDIYDALVAKREGDGADNITFLGRVEPQVLHAITSSATLGLSLLENRGLNYYYSLPNRIADFVQAGVPVLATDFPEIRAVVQRYGIGTLVPAAPFDSVTRLSSPPDPRELARVIHSAIDEWEAMPDIERRQRFELAAKHLSWQNDKKILIERFGTIFE